jgi:hypothetical protein
MKIVSFLVENSSKIVCRVLLQTENKVKLYQLQYFIDHFMVAFN